MTSSSSSDGSRPPQPPHLPEGINAWQGDYLEAQYEQWKRDPRSVGPEWQTFFRGFDLGAARPAPAEGGAVPGGAGMDAVAGARTAPSKVDSLIYNYRDLGHLAAELDPLGSQRPFPEQLTLESFGLSDGDLQQPFDPGSLPLPNPAPLADILNLLEETYCRHLGVEYMHIQDRDRRRWLQKRMETVRNRAPFTAEQKRQILERVMAADAFEHFLEKRYVGMKRFGLEGGESLMVILDQLVELGPANGVREYAFGMAHRGRLNVLANVMRKQFDQIFTEFEDTWQAPYVGVGGDVKYHMGYSLDHVTRTGQTVHLTLAPNPSHLAFITSVVMGRSRAKQRLHGDTEARQQVIPVLIHGDAAFAGQGIIAECFNMSKLDGYTVGGTVHVIVNNQLGFTTSQKDLFSGRYCTDIAKMVEAPIFHVNGDDPEACAWAARLALEYRQAFRQDVVIDMWCYRRNGHNEADEPRFTQPLMYDSIRRQLPVAQRYSAALTQEGVLTEGEFDRLHAEYQKVMDAAQSRSKQQPVDPGVEPFRDRWSGMQGQAHHQPVETGVDAAVLKRIAAAIGTAPEGVEPHKTVARVMKQRAELGGDAGVDWGTAEALAFGSLLLEGHPIRLTGQDVERGTFSSRHAVVTCQKSGEQHIPLNALSPDQARFCVHNSPLTENACMGFEYGYSLVDPRMMVLWEAQFGDFANGAQVIIDQFLASAEVKWHRASGLVLLLPHGHEGLGPEHSTARPERYLELCADDNMQVCAPTTAAQIFHLLRRQMKRNFRKPLIVLSPKSMLRLPAASSPLAEFTKGSFRRVIPDAAIDAGGADPANATRLLLCTGKMSHELLAHRARNGNRSAAIVRVEQLFPFPEEEIEAELRRHPKATPTWVQEETRNGGAFPFMRKMFLDRLGRDLAYIGRPELPSPSGGSMKQHLAQQEKILLEALGPAPAASGAGKSGKEAVSSKH